MSNGRAKKRRREFNTSITTISPLTSQTYTQLNSCSLLFMSQGDSAIIWADSKQRPFT
jgi:hypothetical protein